jgi:hypothetical protein
VLDTCLLHEYNHCLLLVVQFQRSLLRQQDFQLIIFLSSHKHNPYISKKTSNTSSNLFIYSQPKITRLILFMAFIPYFSFKSCPPTLKFMSKKKLHIYHQSSNFSKDLCMLTPSFFLLMFIFLNLYRIYSSIYITHIYLEEHIFSPNFHSNPKVSKSKTS